MTSCGGVSLHEQSRGESFFPLFMHRIGGAGFYVLDEPEAALSPMRQMVLLARMHDLVAKGAQFLTSSHSPLHMRRYYFAFQKIRFVRLAHSCTIARIF